MCSCTYRLLVLGCCHSKQQRVTYSKGAELDQGYSLQKEFSPHPKWPEILVWWFCPSAINQNASISVTWPGTYRKDLGPVRALRHQAQSCCQGQEWKIPIILLLLSELAHISARVVFSHLWPWHEFSKINKLLVSLHQLYHFFPSGLSAHITPLYWNGPLPPFSDAKTGFSGLNSASPGTFSWPPDTESGVSCSCSCCSNLYSLLLLLCYPIVTRYISLSSCTWKF